MTPKTAIKSGLISSDWPSSSYEAQHLGIMSENLFV